MTDLFARLRHRYRSTEITFGLTGRVIATLVVLSLVWLFKGFGVFGWVALGMLGAGGFLSQAFRDIWRRVPDPEERRLADPPRPELSEDYVPIADREVPKRW